MIRRLLIPLLGSGQLLAAGAGSALAKCEGPNPPAFCQQTVASIDFGSTGGTIRGGTVTQVRVWVSRGEQPADASSVTLVFARIANATVVRAAAMPSVEPGLWRADVNLPAGGSWTVVAEIGEVDGTMQRQTLDTLRVGESLTPPAEQPATPISPATPSLPVAILVAGIAAAETA
jgi:hypothetical protein